MPTIAAIITCFNRKKKTISALTSLYTSLLNTQNVNLSVYLVDDGSTDGTSEEVSKLFPAVKIIKGSGNLYWSGGMRLGFAEAMKTVHDFYLWLNDDVILNSYAIENLLKCYLRNLSISGSESVVVGALCNLDNDQVIYGGLSLVGTKLLQKNQFVYSPDEDLECDSFHGNCVFIPNNIASTIGGIDPVFIHAMGDSDYGYRCSLKGFKIFCCKEIVGLCDNDQGNYKLYSTLAQGDWKFLPLFLRLKVVTNPKNFPFKPWFIYSYRYLGWLWLLRFLRPYVLAIFPQLTQTQ